MGTFCIPSGSVVLGRCSCRAKLSAHKFQFSNLTSFVPPFPPNPRDSFSPFLRGEVHSASGSLSLLSPYEFGDLPQMRHVSHMPSVPSFLTQLTFLLRLPLPIILSNLLIILNNVRMHLPEFKDKLDLGTGSRMHKLTAKLFFYS